MENEEFLDKSEINNFDWIVDFILHGDKVNGRLAIEHVGDIIFYLNSKDKQRDMLDPELKKATLTILKALLDTKTVELDWEHGWASSKYDAPPKTDNEIYDIVEKYWYKDDGFGLDRNYLLFFKRKNRDSRL